MNRVILKLDATGHGTVEVNGVAMPVQALDIRAGVSEPTRVTLRLIGVEIDAEFEETETFIEAEGTLA